MDLNAKEAAQNNKRAPRTQKTPLELSTYAAAAAETRDTRKTRLSGFSPIKPRDLVLRETAGKNQLTKPQIQRQLHKVAEELFASSRTK